MMLIRDSWDFVCGRSTVIRSDGIQTIGHQNNLSNNVKYITHIQCKLAKHGNVHPKFFFLMRHCNNNMVSVRSQIMRTLCSK